MPNSPKKLINLDVTEDGHPQLYQFLRHHPELLVVFHNIAKDRPLDEGVLLASGDSKEIVHVYIEHLHIPLLLENQVIARSETRLCGFEPLVAGFNYRGYDSVHAARLAADRAVAIGRAAKPTDNKSNSVYCYYHGAGESIRASQTLLNKIRELVLEYAAAPGELEQDSTGMTFDLVVSARLSRTKQEEM
jgi:hypothetical protein